MARTNNGRIMSNGYQRGGAQLKRSSTLDTIEQIARISQALTGGARERRQRRDAYTLNYFNEATSGYKTIYDQSQLSAMLLNLDDYNRKNKHKMSVESQDLYNLSRQKVKNHMNEVAHYDSMIGKIDALPNKALAVVEQLAIYDSLNGEDAKRKYANDNWKFEDGSVRTRGDIQDELQGYMVEYSSYMKDFFGRHGERVQAQGRYLADRYLGLQQVLIDSVDALDDGLLSQGEKDYIKKNLIVPDADAIKTWGAKRKNEAEFLETQNRENITKSIANYRELEQEFNSGFTTIEGAGSGVTGEGGGDRQIYIGTGNKEELRNYYSGFYDNNDDIERAINESLNERNAMIKQMAILKDNIRVADEAYVGKGGISIADGLNFDTSLALKVKDVDEPKSTPKSKSKPKEDEEENAFVSWAKEQPITKSLQESFDANQWLDDEGYVTKDDKRDYQRTVGDITNTFGLGPDLGKDIGTGLYRLAQYVDKYMLPTAEAAKPVVTLAENLANQLTETGKKRKIYLGDIELGEIGEDSWLYRYVTMDE